MSELSTPTLLSVRDVCRVTTLSRTQISKYREAGKFPAPVPLGEKRIAFLASEVEAWIKSRVALRDKRQAA